MRRTAPLLAVLVVLLAACGSRPVAHSSPPPTSVPTQTPAPSTQPAGPFIVVLEGGSMDTRPNTVSILGVDGRTVATATFLPLKLPVVGMAATRLQSEAQVGALGVYYLDGNGVVRLLRPSGQSSVVTTFPVTPVQHEVWYAISQEGDRLLAGVLTLPAVQTPGPGQPSRPPLLVGSYKFDLERAQAGGQAEVLQHIESPLPAGTPGANWHATFPVGWTQSGPVAMIGAPLATQNVWYGGALYTIGASGDAVARIGGTDCQAASILPSGTVPCISGNGDVSVRDASGHVLWTPSGISGFDALNLKLSPAGDAVTDGRHAATATGTVTLPEGFTAQGWVDSTTVYGRVQSSQGPGHLAYVSLGDASYVHDLGFAADFVGVVVPGR